MGFTDHQIPVQIPQNPSANSFSIVVIKQFRLHIDAEGVYISWFDSTVRFCPMLTPGFGKTPGEICWTFLLWGSLKGMEVDVELLGFEIPNLG